MAMRQGRPITVLVGIAVGALMIHGLSAFPSSNSSRAERNMEDDLSQLIELAYENGEFLRNDEWSEANGRIRNRSLVRDTSRAENGTARSENVQRSVSPHQGQRRLYGHQQDSAHMRNQMQSDGQFVFPSDDLHPLPNVTPTPATVPVCQGSTFCERTPYYPQDLINRAIQRNSSIKYLAAVDVVLDVVQRIDATDDVPLCISEEQVVYPKSAENKRKEWLYVVNQDNFKQGVRIETCRNENSDCTVIDLVPEGYKMTCKQKYIYRQLAAVSDDGSIAPEMFRFPSSCCCFAKFVGNPLLRMASSSASSQKGQTSVAKNRRRK